MREIKFRTWNKTTKNMLDVTFMKFNPEFARMEVSDWSKTDTMADEYELMQYTGLKDKNGVEIYEGDIVKSKKEYNSYTGMNSELYGGNIYEVKSNGWRFFLNPKNIYSPDLKNLEVIGNIYDNPELLKGEK